MVKYIFTIVFLITYSYISAQIDTISNKMITFIEEPPLVSGNLDDFVEMHLIYPQQAKQDSLTGIVIVDYWIDTTGLTINHKVIRGIRKDLDNEALRVAKLIKYDKPAMQRGKPIKVKYTIPIEFKLTDKKELKKKRRKK